MNLQFFVQQMGRRCKEDVHGEVDLIESWVSSGHRYLRRDQVMNLQFGVVQQVACRCNEDVDGDWLKQELHLIESYVGAWTKHLRAHASQNLGGNLDFHLSSGHVHDLRRKQVMNLQFVVQKMGRQCKEDVHGEVDLIESWVGAWTKNDVRAHASQNLSSYESQRSLQVMDLNQLQANHCMGQARPVSGRSRLRDVSLMDLGFVNHLVGARRRCCLRDVKKFRGDSVEQQYLR